MKLTNGKPMILAYRIVGKDQQTLKAEMERLNVEVRFVLPEQEDAPLGLLAGQTGWRSGKAGKAAPEAKDLTEPMAILCSLGDRKMDEVLAAFRSCGVRVALKAVLTDYNVAWSGRQLQTELMRERFAMAAQLQTRRR